MEAATLLSRAVEAATVGRRHYFDLGRAITDVHQAKAWKDHHATFASYCRDELGISLKRAYALMSAFEVFQSLSRDPRVKMLPVNELQTRPLKPYSDADRSACWRRAISLAGGKQPPFRLVQQAVAGR